MGQIRCETCGYWSVMEGGLEGECRLPDRGGSPMRLSGSGKLYTHGSFRCGRWGRGQVSKECEHCGLVARDVTVRRKYCSENCRMAAYRARKKAALGGG